MSKYSLYDLFHADREKYNEEYIKRFNDDNAIKLDIFIGGNQAFFCPSVALYRILLSIERTDKIIDKLYKRLPPKAIDQFAKRCLIDEIVLSNNIEGVHSTRKEILDILEDLSKQKKQNRFAGLVNKYALLMSNDKLLFETCEDIRKIYDDIFYAEIKMTDSTDLPDGKIFRKDSVGVYSASNKLIHNGLYPESVIIDTMERALKFLNDDKVDFLFRIAVFHYLFGYIHPFYDGNGRMSRFVSSYLLSHRFNHIIGYRLSYTIKENIGAYYDAFKKCNHPNNKADLTPFIEMFLNIVDISERQLCEALKKRVDRLDFYGKAIDKLPYGKDKVMHGLYFVLVQASLFSDIGIGLKELEQCMEMSYNTIKAKLKLIPEEFIVLKMNGRKKHLSINLDMIDKCIRENFGL